MKKSVTSFISSNRNIIVVLAVLLGVALTGVIAWQVRAMGAGSDSEVTSREVTTDSASRQPNSQSASNGILDPNSAQPSNQEAGRGTYRGSFRALRFDISPPLRDLARGNRGTPAKEERERDEFENRPTGLEGPFGIQDIDKTVQSVTNPFAPMAVPTPIISFDSTIGCGGCAPPDPNGEVGPNHFVVMGNTQFQIFSKTGTSMVGPSNINTLWAGFGGNCQTANSGDPVVLYDQLDDRWILTQFTATSAPFLNCVAVSTSPDPTGTYFRYAFQTAPSGANFPDYPKYGMWSDALYIATREFLGTGGAFQGVGAYAINRAQLIAGNPAAQVISFLASPASAGGAFNVGDGLLPTDLDGMQPPPAGSPNYFFGSMDNGGPYSAPQDALTLWKFHADFATPANSTFTLANTIPIASYDTIPAFCGGTRACIPQSGTTNLLDHLGYRERPLFRAAYRNFGNHESIVTNQSVEASTTMSGIRWWEIRSPNSSPVLFQDATYAPGLTDGFHRWMGSIAMDTVGNMALGYSRSSSTIFPSTSYTGRLAGDPINTMPQGEADFKVGTGSQTGGGNRWGDYSDMTVDPVDDCTFWYASEYVPATSAAGWRITIGAFKFPSCSLGPSFSMSVTPGTRDICAPAPATYTVDTTSVSGFTTPITLSATGNPAGSTVTFVPNPVVPGNPSTMTVTTAGAAAGTSTIHVTGTAGAITQNQDVTLKLTTQAPGPITLTAPANGASGVDLNPTFTWTASTQATTYTLEIATDAAFTNIVHTASGLTTTTYSGAHLSSLTHYFWRVRGINTCGIGANAATFDFTTALICIVPFSNTAPIAINDNVAGSPYPSNIAVSGLTGTVTAVTVTLTGMSHTFPDDVDIMVVGPGGQNTMIMSDVGGGGDITSLNFTFDDAAAAGLPDATQIVGGTFKPSDFDTASDVFPAPAPPRGATVAMSVFNGSNPNGTWSLYVRDDLGIDSGTISGGWTVTITTSCTATTPSPTPTASPSNSPTATNTATATATSTPTPGPTCAANFANATAIAINDNVAGSPYPSNIAVSGLTGTVTKVTVDLTGMSHTFPDDVDIMLVGPAGQNTMIMSDVGGGGDITSLNFTFDDAAAAGLPDATQIVGGTFKPSDFDTASDVFPAPAPPRGATVAMSVFNATDPNGTWSLYVRDDLGIDSGTISGGWALHIVTTTTACGTPTATSTGSPSGTPTSTATNTSTPVVTSTGTPSCTPVVLYDQTSSAGTNGVSSQDFETANDAFDDRGADDFVVPAGQTWTVSKVVAGGLFFNGAGPVNNFNVTFYNNAGTLPGTAVAGGTFTGASYTNASGMFTITLPGSVTLPAGTYWVSVQARMDFTPGGQWAWTDRTATSNSPAAWQNPGGGFSLPACVGWAPRGATCAIDAAAPDQVFQIVGTNGTGTCPTATATNTPTASPSGTPATPTNTSTATATPTGGPTCAVNFSNTALIDILDNSAANPYPSNITVAGLTGTVTKVTVDLTGVSHTFPDDIDIMLVGPGGQNTMIMSDVGGGGDITSLNFTFDDAAAAGLPDATQIVGGTFKPSDFDTASDVFPAPAPPRGATVAMSVFNATDPNGTWSLYVRDDLGIDVGSIAGGWALHITTTTSCGTPTATFTGTPPPTATNTATPTASPSCTPSERIADGTFEAGTPWPLWTVQTSTNFGTPNCNTALCGTGGGTAPPFAGDNWAWFGGATAAESATLGQTVTISGAPATLTFQMRIGSVTSPFTDTLVLTIDGTQIASWTEPAVAEAAYTLRTYDVSQFANGAPHALLFSYQSGDGASNFTVDNVSLIGGCGPIGTATNTPTASPSTTATATATPTACGVTFSNTASIAINDNAAGSPYPSNIAVSGLTGTVTKVTVDLTGMSHTFPDDVDIMLVGPGGQNTMVMSDVGGGGDITNLNFTFDDAAAASLPDATQIVGGTFKPSDFDTASDVFPAPAPPRGATVAMSVFNGSTPNGTWSLYVRDDLGIDSGTISGGWALHIATTTTCGSPSATPTFTATATPTAGGAPSIQFSSATYTEDESQTAVITVNRTGSTTGTNTVNFSTSDGTATGGASCSTAGVDYISVTNQAVTFNPGDTSKTVNVQICSDTLTEPAQTINLALTGSNLGSPSTAVLTINDVASAYRSSTAICTTFAQPGSPYPSTIVVPAGAPAQIGSMRVTLFDVAHTTPDSMDFLLVGPGGQKFILMADAGGTLDLTTPVTLTFSDTAGQVVPNSAPLSTGTFEPTSWEPGQASFPPPAPAAPYNEPGSTVGGTGTQTLLGNFGGTNAVGTWSLYMRDDGGSLVQAVTGCVNGGWGLEFFASTAANASVSGRVLTANGQGIRNAKVVITGNSLSQPIVATTGSFGYYTFEGLRTGETYVVTVFSKRYTFSAPSRVISLVDNVADADFIADPQD